MKKLMLSSVAVMVVCIITTSANIASAQGYFGPGPAGDGFPHPWDSQRNVCTNPICLKAIKQAQKTRQRQQPATRSRWR
jgi:hypothetical protein